MSARQYMTCEWCDEPASYRIKAPGYKRFACQDPNAWWTTFRTNTVHQLLVISLSVTNAEGSTRDLMVFGSIPNSVSFTE